MYPKPEKRKKKKQHKASILHCRDGTCYLCMCEGVYRRYSFVHEHHIFGGANRQISEAEGLKVYLCLEHHTAGPKAVHDGNSEMMQFLHEKGQQAYERTHTRKEFIERFGRNYLGQQAEETNEQENNTGAGIPDGFMFLNETGGEHGE